MAKFERNCVVCGRKYTFCPNKNDGAPRWHLIYCGDNCRDIWNSITTVYDQDGALVAAQNLLDKDLSDIENMRTDVKEKIEMIFSEAGLDPLTFEDDEEYSEDSMNIEDDEDEFDDESSDSVSPSVDE